MADELLCLTVDDTPMAHGLSLVLQSNGRLTLTIVLRTNPEDNEEVALVRQVAHDARRDVLAELSAAFTSALASTAEYGRFIRCRRELRDAEERLRQAADRATDLAGQRGRLLAEAPDGLTDKLRALTTQLDAAVDAQRAAAADVDLLAPLLAERREELQRVFSPQQDELTGEVRDRLRACRQHALDWISEDGAANLTRLVRAEFGHRATLMSPTVTDLARQIIDGDDLAAAPAELTEWISGRAGR